MRMTPQLALLTIQRWIDVLPGRCAAAMGGQLGSAADTPWGRARIMLVCYMLQSIQYKFSKRKQMSLK